MQRSVWDYHTLAREALRGKWDSAVAAAFVAGLLGAYTAGSASLQFQISADDLQTLRELTESSLWERVQTGFVTVGTVLGVLSLIQFLCGGAASLGYVRYNLNLIDRREARVGDVTAEFGRFWQGFLLLLLRRIYIFLWSLLFIVPGIVKAYSYAMAPYLLYEHDVLGSDGAITASKKMMQGHRMDLFILDVSFLGWQILCSLPPTLGALMLYYSTRDFFSTGGVLYLMAVTVLLSAGYLLLIPYQQAAYAAFYRDLRAEYTASEPPEEPAEDGVAERFLPEDDGE